MRSSATTAVRQKRYVRVVGGASAVVQASCDLRTLRGMFGDLTEEQRKNYRVHKIKKKKYWLLKLSRTLVILFLISRFKWEWGRSRLQTGSLSYCLRFLI